MSRVILPIAAAVMFFAALAAWFLSGRKPDRPTAEPSGPAETTVAVPAAGGLQPLAPAAASVPDDCRLRLEALERRLVALEQRLKISEDLDGHQRQAALSLAESVKGKGAEAQERRAVRNVERAARDLAKLKANQPGLGERVGAKLSALNRQVSLKNEQVERTVACSVDYLEKRTHLIAESLQGFIAAGGVFDSKAGLGAALKTLDDGFLPKLEEILDAGVALTVFDELQGIIRVPFYLEREFDQPFDLKQVEQLLDRRDSGP